MLAVVGAIVLGCGGGGGSSSGGNPADSGGSTSTTTLPPEPDNIFDNVHEEAACDGAAGSGAGGGSATAPADGLFFVDANDEAGLPRQRAFVASTSAECMSNGIAAVDYDADGDLDLFVLGGADTPHSLYQNQGDGTYVDVAPGVGLDLVHRSSGPAFADIDGDGDLDLFIGGMAGDPYYLLENDGGIFVDVTGQSGLVLTTPNTLSATFDDYDGDGDLDLFLGHHSAPGREDTETLWRNMGDGTFESYSIQSGIAGTLLGEDGTGDNLTLTDYTFTPNLSDVDGDGDRDLLMAADYGTSQVFINEGNGTFTRTTDKAVITDEAGMGAAVGDYDNDGDMDWFVSSIYGGDLTGNRLYRNDGNGVFEDVTVAAGVDHGFWGWGSCFADFDNDGYLDIFHVNGFFLSGFEDDPVRFFHANGDGTFTERAADIGLTDNGQGRGIACHDADRDGDLDIVLVNNSENYLIYYRNDLSNSNHYLGIKLESTGANRHGIGAWITVTTPLGSQVREIHAGNNYVSQNPAEAHFGLASATTADVEVRWPDGGVTSLSAVAVDQLLTVSE